MSLLSVVSPSSPSSSLDYDGRSRVRGDDDRNDRLTSLSLDSAAPDSLSASSSSSSSPTSSTSL